MEVKRYQRKADELAAKAAEAHMRGDARTESPSDSLERSRKRSRRGVPHDDSVGLEGRTRGLWPAAVRNTVLSMTDSREVNEVRCQPSFANFPSGALVSGHEPRPLASEDC